MLKNLIDKFKNNNFADVVTCMTAGAVMADGVVNPEEINIVKQALQNDHRLAVFSPKDLLKRFDKYLNIYKYEIIEHDSGYRVDIEWELFRSLKTTEERQMAFDICHEIIKVDGITPDEHIFLQRISGLEFLGVHYSGLDQAADEDSHGMLLFKRNH